MTVKDAIRFFIHSLQYEQLSTHTIRAYGQDLEQWENTMSKETLEELNFEDFQQYLSFLQDEKLKIASLRRKRIVIHRFLKFCYEKKFCTERLFEYIQPLKVKKNSAPKEILSKEEITKIKAYLLEEIEKYKSNTGTTHYDYLYYCAVRNRLIIYILLYTGCRANEAVSIEKQHIDRGGNTITILAKGHKYNAVPIHEELKNAIILYEQQLEVLKDSDVLGQVENSKYLFPSRQDRKAYLATRTLYDLMGKLSEVVERSIHAHLFRHTFASYCIAANMDITTLSALVSHSNPSITLSIYTHEIQGNQKQKEMKKVHFDF